MAESTVVARADALKHKPPITVARRRKRSMTKSLGKEVLMRYAGYDQGVVPKCPIHRLTL